MLEFFRGLSFFGLEFFGDREKKKPGVWLVALRSLLHGEICSFWETSQGKNRTSVNLGKKIFFCELIFCQRGEKVLFTFPISSKLLINYFL